MRRVGIALLGLSMLLLASMRGDLGWSASTLSPSPKFELVTSTGDMISNVTLRGRPALLIFWAPWCNFCRKELPEIANFYRQEKPEPLHVVSIGFADLRSNVEAFINARPEVFVFPTAYDEDRWVAQAFKVRGTPTYVLLDADGQIALTHLGAGLLQNELFHELLMKMKKS